jgi:hypothetical protein
MARSTVPMTIKTFWIMTRRRFLDRRRYFGGSCFPLGKCRTAKIFLNFVDPELCSKFLQNVRKYWLFRPVSLSRNIKVLKLKVIWRHRVRIFQGRSCNQVWRISPTVLYFFRSFLELSCLAEESWESRTGYLCTLGSWLELRSYPSRWQHSRPEN